MAQREISEETWERRRQALQQVRQWGDPALRTVAQPIDPADIDGELVAEAGRLIAIMDAALGVGLAATQAGIMRRYVVLREGEDGAGDAITLVNPSLEWQSEETDVASEGCLSLEGVWVDVERPVAVRVRALDLSGRELTIEAKGPYARRLQHEIDHLDGVLMLDRAPKEQRKAALRALREGVVMDAPADATEV
ncbi:peptide deformylase [Patulibacter brassicae]|jgi:peptide deformylase|uniref:Peptide deformylase n=1 Tax=Patulibacter brassicae TaxID=1705717 RepID=A0ABU4VJS7_9ACTN|nr:peptide deformylase [Patulibacter brassicae]MDX8151143.1 peptide deformylase [Patulibacter brassicae]